MFPIWHVLVCFSLMQYIVVVAVTVLMDIIQLGLYYDDREDMYGRGDSRWARTWQFSAAMMIISLMVKPLTIALACVALYLRSGVTLTNLLGEYPPPPPPPSPLSLSTLSSLSSHSLSLSH